jgi:hypothetical protein
VQGLKAGEQRPEREGRYDGYDPNQAQTGGRA